MEEVEEEEDEEEELDDADGAGLVLCTTDVFGEGMATGTSGNTGIEEKSGKLVSSSPRISSRKFLSLSHSFLGLANLICGFVICEGAAVAGAGFLFSFVSQNFLQSLDVLSFFDFIRLRRHNHVPGFIYRVFACLSYLQVFF